MRRAAKIDRDQPEIVDGLIRFGATVQSLATVGVGCPDLLVGFKERNYLLEVKNESDPPSAQKLTDYQKAWHKMWRGRVATVRSLSEAILVLMGDER